MVDYFLYDESMMYTVVILTSAVFSSLLNLLKEVGRGVEQLLINLKKKHKKTKSVKNFNY